MKASSRRLATAALVLVCGAAAQALTLADVARADETVISCGPYSTTGVFAPISKPPVQATGTCPGTGYGGDGSGFYLSPGSGTASQGQNALWQANAPAGLTIVHADVTDVGSIDVNSGNQGEYGGDFYWSGGTSNITPNETRFASPPMSSSYFGIQLVCGRSRCSPSNINPTTYILAQQAALSVRETSGPQLVAPTGLWQANGWVRGTWPLFVWGNSPSGLCGIVADFDAQTLPGSTSARNPTTWHECAAPPIQDTVNTPGYAQGANNLHIGGYDAAGETVDYAKLIYVDNQPPSVSLAGLSDAPSTAGTQYVTATAAAGPSGVAGISCSVDGAAAYWYPGASAQVPVSGLGEHHVQCVSESNAVDPHGVHGQSAPGSFAISIRQPTVMVISFSKFVDGLRCHRIRALVRIPAGWVKVHRRHKLVRVHRRRQTKLERVTRCHARIKRERVTVVVKVHRRGKTVLVKRTKVVGVVLAPHVVSKTSLRVLHGHGVTVHGWLGTNALTALGGQPVELLSAPDNGLRQFTPAAVVSTAVNGSWSARLPAGPSRLVIAVYHGGPLTEPNFSSQVRVVIPAKVRLMSVTRRVAWGGTVRIVGQLEGGYLPSGGALVRLRIGQGSQYFTYGVKEHVGGDGRFTTTYTFGAGDPSVHRSFFFELVSLPTGNYPFAPAASRQLSVLVGGHPVTNLHGGHHPRHR